MSAAAPLHAPVAHERGFARVGRDSNADAAAKLDYSAMVQELRASVREQRLTTYEFRIQQLQAIRRAMDERMDDILKAATADLGRHPIEGFQGEVMGSVGEADDAIANLKEWMKPVPVATPLLLQPSSSWVVPQPKGVMLVIAPWNFPLYLAFSGIIGAIAAGNAVVVKPSEVTPHCSKLVQEICDKYLDKRVVRCVLGGIPETTALLRERFDHILYTGNGAVGRIVHAAAAKHLTPVTLELGGKSPVYVDKSANLKVAANRIMQTKLFNNGQICVAPDYVLVHENVAKELVGMMKENLIKWLGNKPQTSESLGRLVSQHHFDRIKNLLSDNHGGEVVIGGLDQADRNDRFIPPTIVLNPNPNSHLMMEEIFGPVLPVLVVRDENEAIKFINSRESPLALYVFTESEPLYTKVIDQTLAGGSCVNDCVFHITNNNFGFGGVGTAGFGAYHGKAGFDEFSHRRSVMYRSTWIDPSNRYMPYKASEVGTLKKIIIGPLIPPNVKYGMIAGGAALAAATVMKSFL